MSYTIHHGDCLDVLKTINENSVDSIVTDPPYGLSFMGKAWDHSVPSVEIWNECLRVLKPGGHLLAFAGTRTQHRMAVNIEDAGFEIRDLIAWVYGSGFPKSLDVSKAIDKNNGEIGRLHKFTEWMRTTGLKSGEINRITSTTMGGHYLTAASQPSIPTPELWALLRPHIEQVPAWVDDLVDRIAAEREVLGVQKNAKSGWDMDGGTKFADRNITAPATDAARQWAGFGTALKPALEPITVARKPFKGTVADNVLTHGTGAINVDGCRVGTEDLSAQWGREWKQDETFGNGKGASQGKRSPLGRWPANFIHDGSDEVVDLFPQTKSSAGKKQTPSKNTNAFGDYGATDKIVGHNHNGSAARYFYCAKASKRDRDEGCEGMEERKAAAMNQRCVNCGHGKLDGRRVGPFCDNPQYESAPPRPGNRNHHPTVKPTDLMRYLCRLVTPPNGTVLDPFMGSGSTGKSATLEGFYFIGIELDADYIEIARARIDAVDPDNVLS